MHLGRYEIKVSPNAKKSRILSSEDGKIKLAIAAPPEDGKANRELVKFLSKETGLKVRIVKGLSSKNKIVELY